jgi:hypothetical protein
MSAPLDIGAFLAQSAREGESDGVGEFTVAHQQAARKLARFSLPRVSAWVTKLIQAAVRLQAHSVEIRQSLTETFLHLELKRLPTEETLVSAIVAGSLDRGGALEGLALALRAIVEQAGLSFLLVIDDGRHTPRPIYAGRHFSRLSEKARRQHRYHPRPGLSLTVRHRPAQTDFNDTDEVLRLLRGYRPILEELHRTSFACPVPLHWKGDRLNGLISSRELGLGNRNRLMLMRGLRGLGSSPEQLALPEDFEDRAPSLNTPPFRLKKSGLDSPPAQAVLVLSVGLGLPLGGRSRLLWLNDGVVVQEERLSMLDTEVLQMTLLANACGLATDLTGFSLVGNESFQQRREEVLRAAGLALAEPTICDNLFLGPDQVSPDADAGRKGESVLALFEKALKDKNSVLEVRPETPLTRSELRSDIQDDGFPTGPLALSLARSRPKRGFSAGLLGLSFLEALAMPAGLAKRVMARDRDLLSLDWADSRDKLQAAIRDDLRRAIELLTGEKPPPPPGPPVQFVVRKR